MLVKKMALRTQVEIEASAERVWAVFSNLPQWGSFNSFLRVEDAPATLGRGQPLRVALQPPGHARPNLMTPQIVDYEPGSKLKWRGKLWGTNVFFVGEHFFQLQPLGPNKTLFLHGEDFRGCLVPLLGGVLKDTQKGFVEFNNGLKRAVEAEAGAAGAAGGAATS